jgi:hypothetical protein
MRNQMLDSISLRRMAIGAIVAALLGAVLSFAWAAPASAQQPAICQQYPQLPICVGPGGGGDEDDDDDGDPGAFTAGGASAGGDGDGNLPFTGFPITDLILLLVALLLAGLGIRAAQALRQRFGSAASP